MLRGASDMRGDVQAIFKETPHDKQVMMFSATLAKEIRAVCKKFMSPKVRAPWEQAKHPEAGRSTEAPVADASTSSAGSSMHSVSLQNQHRCHQQQQKRTLCQATQAATLLSAAGCRGTADVWAGTQPRSQLCFLPCWAAQAPQAMAALVAGWTCCWGEQQTSDQQCCRQASYHDSALVCAW